MDNLIPIDSVQKFSFELRMDFGLLLIGLKKYPIAFWIGVSILSGRNLPSYQSKLTFMIGNQRETW